MTNDKIEQLSTQLTLLRQEFFGYDQRIDDAIKSCVLIKQETKNIVDKANRMIETKLEPLEREVEKFSAFATYLINFFNPDVKAKKRINELEEALDKKTKEFDKLKQKLKGLTS
jgi:predicted RNase H-like nuclease (RuvC/YqgF family)